MNTQKFIRSTVKGLDWKYRLRNSVNDLTKCTDRGGTRILQRGWDSSETPKASRPRRNRGAIGAEGSGSGRDVPLASGGGSVEGAQPLHSQFFEFFWLWN